MTSVYALVNLQTDFDNNNSTLTKRTFHDTPSLIKTALLEKTRVPIHPSQWCILNVARISSNAETVGVKAMSERDTDGWPLAFLARLFIISNEI